MLKIIYGKKGAPVPDHEVYDWVDYNIDSYLSFKSIDKVVFTCNEMVLITFALRVLEEKISVNKVEFYMGEQKLEFDPVLGLQNPEGSIIGIYSEIIEKSLQISHIKIREEKKKSVVP